MADLERFLKAQEYSYDTALKEIKNGKKVSYWMWYIFPQIEGLGTSSTAMYYAIKDKKEAEEYISNPVLWNRILEISSVLLSIDSSDPYEVMGYPDNRKLKSSMTLFYEVSGNEIFKKVLDKFYNGEEDGFTLEKLNK
ncbi:MAG: DUF1810 domain-containing protein [Candidatus Limousia pullorum]